MEVKWITLKELNPVYCHFWAMYNGSVTLFEASHRIYFYETGRTGVPRPVAPEEIGLVAKFEFPLPPKEENTNDI